MVLAPACALLPLACATSGRVLAPENRLTFPAYSVVVPLDQGWQLLQLDRENSSADVALTVSEPTSMVFRMQFMQIGIAAQYLRQLTAGGVADHYRRQGERNLRILGTQKGWRIDGVAMGEDAIGPNHFFTARFEFQSATHREAVWEFLYFPRAEKNERFIRARYSETTPPGVSASSSSRYADFLEALKSLRMDK